MILIALLHLEVVVIDMNNLNEENKTFKFEKDMFRQPLCHRQFTDGITMMKIFSRKLE